jgi:hypothetical protein
VVFVCSVCRAWAWFSYGFVGVAWEWLRPRGVEVRLSVSCFRIQGRDALRVPLLASGCLWCPAPCGSLWFSPLRIVRTSRSLAPPRSTNPTVSGKSFVLFACFHGNAGILVHHQLNPRRFVFTLLQTSGLGYPATLPHLPPMSACSSPPGTPGSKESQSSAWLVITAFGYMVQNKNTRKKEY